MKKRIAPFLISALAFTGCLSSRELRSSSNVRIPATARITITVPADGSYEEDTYAGSGKAVATELRSALIREFPNTEIGSNRAGYTVKPTILHWEERATEWSGKPDRVSISVQLYEGARLMDSTVIDGKSSYWTLGGDHPRDLLRQPFETYARKLAGSRHE
jgi:hypothetical protein